jgi:nucleotide-binding universal stress UspA family protein
MTNRIVVGVDGSEPSKGALRWASFMADVTGSAIEAVAVWQVAPMWEGAGWSGMAPDWDQSGDLEKMLAATVDEVFGADRPGDLSTVVRPGSAAKALVEASAGAQMLIVGSRGHGGFAGLRLGSVSAACAAHACCPVLVIHGSTPPPPERGPSALPAVAFGEDSLTDDSLGQTPNGGGRN